MDKDEIKKILIYPVRYDRFGQYIFDAESHVVANIRGWGRLQYLEDGDKAQDAIGQFVADAINEKLK